MLDDIIMELQYIQVVHVYIYMHHGPVFFLQNHANIRTTLEL